MPHITTGSSASRRPRAVLPIILLGALSCAPSFCQSAPSDPAGQRSPRDWAVLASNNEVLAIDHAGSALRYRVHTVDAKGDRLRQIVECTGGTVSRLLAINGQSLTSDQDAEERKRLQDLAADPDTFAHHSEQDSKAKTLARDLLHLMPDAMVYTRVPAEDGHSASGSPTLAFDFSPNPQWHPPSTISEALTGLHGRVWVDARSGYVEHMRGEVFRPVNFGFGMVAHVFPGGRVDFTQADVGEGRWIYSHFAQRLRVRALLLKTINIDTTIDATDFHPIAASLTYQQAIAMLLR